MDISTLGTFGFDGGLLGIVGTIGVVLFKKLSHLDKGLSQTMNSAQIKSYIDEMLKEHLELIDYKLKDIMDRLNKITKVSVKKG